MLNGTGQYLLIISATLPTTLRHTASEYWLKHSAPALSLIISSPASIRHWLLLKRLREITFFIQLDTFHAQKVDGNLTHLIRDYAGKYAHVQIAGLPDRHEPDDGEINYPWLFRLFDEVGYQGWIGCEYKPRGLTEEGLGWFDALALIRSIPNYNVPIHPPPSTDGGRLTITFRQGFPCPQLHCYALR